MILAYEPDESGEKELRMYHFFDFTENYSQPELKEMFIRPLPSFPSNYHKMYPFSSHRYVLIQTRHHDLLIFDSLEWELYHLKSRDLLLFFNDMHLDPSGNFLALQYKFNEVHSVKIFSDMNFHDFMLNAIRLANTEMESFGDFAVDVKPLETLAIDHKPGFFNLGRGPLNTIFCDGSLMYTKEEEPHNLYHVFPDPSVYG